MIASVRHWRSWLRFATANRAALDTLVIRRAIEVARAAHANQFRISGEPAVLHAVFVARMLAIATRDAAIVICALLHDAVEDTALERSDLQRDFGWRVADTVALMTKDGPGIPPPVMQLAAARTAGAKESEVLRSAFVLKINDRLHNMMTVHALPAPRRLRLARETIGVLVPLAADIAPQYVSPMNRLCAPEL